MSACRCAMGRGARLRIASYTTAVVLPPNAWTPVTISYSTAPSENKSVRESIDSPRACSGDMYDTAPSAAPGCVRDAHVGVGGVARRGRVGGARVRRRSARELGEAEVEHLHAVSIANEDVRRLDIPMHDALGMGRRQRVS